MKVMILAGGLGTRLGEETAVRPKPMVGIGGYPILWHIMKIYSHYGFNDFVILTGYKQEVIKEYFVNFYLHHSDVTVDLASNAITVHKTVSEPWKISLVYTGRNTMTGARIKRARTYVQGEPFMLTYGDGVSNVDLTALLRTHRQSGKLCTLTAYQPEGRFGALDLAADGTVKSFREKPKDGGAWINAGFFVCQPEIFDYIDEGNDISWEEQPLRRLSTAGKLGAYYHRGFWHPMDMLKDKTELNNLWREGRAPWKVWP